MCWWQNDYMKPPASAMNLFRQGFPKDYRTKMVLHAIDYLGWCRKCQIAIVSVSFLYGADIRNCWPRAARVMLNVAKRLAPHAHHQTHRSIWPKRLLYCSGNNRRYCLPMLWLLPVHASTNGNSYLPQYGYFRRFQ
ncbi:hypothetical protein DSECCO2_561180 [anaerobic digester metagenome]